MAFHGNPDMNKAHSKDGVIGKTVQFSDTNDVHCRAVWRTARAKVCPAP